MLKRIVLMLSVLNSKTKQQKPQKNIRKFLEGMDMFSILTVVRYHRCMLMSKLIKMYTLNMYNYLYINYTSINLKK